MSTKQSRSKYTETLVTPASDAALSKLAHDLRVALIPVPKTDDLMYTTPDPTDNEQYVDGVTRIDALRARAVANSDTSGEMPHLIAEAVQALRAYATAAERFRLLEQYVTDTEEKVMYELNRTMLRMLAAQM